MAKRKPLQDKMKCEVEGCPGETDFNLYEIPENPQELKVWLNVCDMCERRIAFNNLKRQGFNPVTGDRQISQEAKPK